MAVLRLQQYIAKLTASKLKLSGRIFLHITRKLIVCIGKIYSKCWTFQHISTSFYGFRTKPLVSLHFSIEALISDKSSWGSIILHIIVMYITILWTSLCLLHRKELISIDRNVFAISFNSYNVADRKQN